MATKSWTVGRDRTALIGVALMVAVAALGAIDAVLVRYLAGGVHPFVIGFTRALFGLLVVLPWLARRPGILKSHFRIRHFLRAGLKLAALICFFYAFALAPLADVTAIAFASPLVVTVGAWLFLSEKPVALRVIALVMGFVGVLIVLRPGQGAGIPAGLLFALAGAVLTATIQLILKPMSGRDSTETLVAWNLILTVPLAVIPALLVWQMPTGAQWALLATQGVLGALAMFLVTKAFSYAEASLITPFEFLRLPFVAILGYYLFAQSAALTTWIGGTVIFVSTLLMARSARRKALSQT